MAELKKTIQTPGGAPTGMTPEGDRGEEADALRAERPTSGTDRDLDRSGTAKNQGHGHPRGERELHHD
ncbi:MAG TPA: hypothetical protein VEW03_14375 [Longimicrobiaceae bacterium]|nr:hypothetical protein [Longimicrobiaceae bacterium]